MVVHRTADGGGDGPVNSDVLFVANTYKLRLLPLNTTDDDTAVISVVCAETLPLAFTTKQADQPLILLDVYFDNYAYGETPVDTPVYISSRVGEDLTISSLTLAGDSTTPFILSNSGETTIPAMSGLNADRRILPVDSLNAGLYNARLVLAYTYNDSVRTTTADVRLTVDKAQWNLSGIRGVFDNAKTLAQQLHLNIEGAPPGAILTYHYGLDPAPGNPRSTVDNDGKTSFTFTDHNGLQPASIYPIGITAEADQNHVASTNVQILGEGYTAYATPVFNDMFTINYVNEQLTLNPDYSSEEQPDGPYLLTSLLDTLTASAFMLSIVHKANPNLPFPASLPGFSDTLNARPDAPTVDTILHVTDDNDSNGEIRIADRYFEYVPHNNAAVRWRRVAEAATGLPAGDYEIRFPANEAAKIFASHTRLVTIRPTDATPTSVTLSTPTPTWTLTATDTVYHHQDADGKADDTFIGGDNDESYARFVPPRPGDPEATIPSDARQQGGEAVSNKESGRPAFSTQINSKSE
jgi:hypothetical protein